MYNELIMFTNILLPKNVMYVNYQFKTIKSKFLPLFDQMKSLHLLFTYYNIFVRVTK